VISCPDTDECPDNEFCVPLDVNGEPCDPTTQNCIDQRCEAVTNCIIDEVFNVPLQPTTFNVDSFLVTLLDSTNAILTQSNPITQTTDLQIIFEKPLEVNDLFVIQTQFIVNPDNEDIVIDEEGTEQPLQTVQCFDDLDSLSAFSPARYCETVDAQFVSVGTICPPDFLTPDRIPDQELCGAPVACSVSLQGRKCERDENCECIESKKRQLQTPTINITNVYIRYNVSVPVLTLNITISPLIQNTTVNITDCVEDLDFWKDNFEQCDEIGPYPTSFGDKEIDDLFSLTPKGGNLWVILVHQYLSTVLNIYCKDNEPPESIVEDLFEIAAFLDVYKFYIDPCSVLRDRAIEFIDKLESYNEGQSSTPSCPDSVNGNDEDDIILNKIRNFKSGAFDGMYTNDPETGLPTNHLNVAGLFVIIGMVCGCVVFVVGISYFIKNRKEKYELNETDLLLENLKK
jgi:hypothetical protein